MKRATLACLAGLLTWMIVVTLINRLLRLTITDYAAAEKTLQFTLAMKWARLLMALITSLAAGAVTRSVATQSRSAPWIVGSLIFALFLPFHVAIWSQFPLWYHLFFLLPIIPAVLAGARIFPGQTPSRLEP
jgi:hypothetical protein